MPNKGAIPTIDAVTNTATPIDHKPGNEGGTITQSNLGPADYAVKDNIQLTSGFNGNAFQEINMFVGEFARVYTLSPRAAALRIREMLNRYLEGAAGVQAA
jgi:hypothetical protein